MLYPGDDVTFSRIGHVSHTSAKLLVREPDPGQLPLGIYYQEVGQKDPGEWRQKGTVYALDNKTDFTVPVTLNSLKPATSYRYSLSNKQTGTFVTAPAPFSKAGGRLSFLTSSCMKPNFPYNPLAHPLRIYGIEQVSDFIHKLPSMLRPSFMLFLGDFIYIDVPQRFGSSTSHYRSEYRRVYSSPSWSYPANDPAINLPWIHTLDDHEIANDWSKGNTTEPYPAAADPFVHYHVSVNPPIPSSPFAKPENTSYFSFINGPASFFMLDTRAYRTEPSQANSTMLGSAQLSSLLTYLARPEPPGVHWKIIASSVPFTKNWHVGTTDTWGGYLHERTTLFNAMWHAERTLPGIRIILLSGDRHEFGAIRFPDPSLPNTSPDAFTPNTAGEGLHEFSVGPLSMFYLPIRSYGQTDEQDVTVKYVPDGNTKFGHIDIATGVDHIDVAASVSGKVTPVEIPASVLTYALYVDGAVVWKYRLSVPLRDDDARDVLARSEARHPRLPPGKVLFEDPAAAGWEVRVKDVLGRVEGVARAGWNCGWDLVVEVLERAWKSERLD